MSTESKKDEGGHLVRVGGYDIGFLGDVFLGGRFAERSKENGGVVRNPFELVRPLLESCDNLCLNLEGPVCKGTRPRPDKWSILHIPSQNLDVLQDIGAHVLCLGNNHAWDYQEEGVSGTLDVLAKRGFRYFGLGRNVAEARRPARLELRDGATIGLLSYTSDEVHTKSHIAGDESPGCARDDLDEIRKDIAGLRRDGVCPVVHLHCGFEFHTLPAPEAVGKARAIIDAGAAMVIGHHPHVLQPVERYGGGVIAYSLGNTFFPSFQYINGSWMDWPALCARSCMLRCRFRRGKLAAVEVNYLALQSDLSVVPVSWVRELRLNAGNHCALCLMRSPAYPRLWNWHHAWMEREYQRLKKASAHALPQAFVIRSYRAARRMAAALYNSGPPRLASAARSLASKARRLARAVVRGPGR